MPKGQLTSPWVYESTDYADKLFRVQIDFDESTHALIGGSQFRDVGCVYVRLLLGIGPDGTPDTTNIQWEVPDGSSGLSAAFLSGAGLNTIDDVLAVQVCAGF